MNNIIVENDNISFENEVINIDVLTKDLKITVNGNVTINEVKCNSVLEKLDIIIKKDSNLIYNRFSSLGINNLDINIIIEDNSSFNGSWAFETHDKHHIKINTSMHGNNISNILNIKALTKEKGDIFISADATVLKNTNNNQLKENIRVLNTNDNIVEVLPNMLISSNEVQADHFNTISGVDADELFYLQSKGISKAQAEKLIEEGFINSLFDDNFIKNIK